MYNSGEVLVGFAHGALAARMRFKNIIAALDMKMEANKEAVKEVTKAAEEAHHGGSVSGVARYYIGELEATLGRSGEVLGGL